MSRVALLLLLLAAPAALAQPEPGWGFTWERVGDRPLDADGLVAGPDETLWAAGDSTRWLDLENGFPGRWRAVPYPRSRSMAMLPLGGDTLITARGSTNRTIDRGAFFEQVAEFGEFTLYELPAGAFDAGRILEGTHMTNGSGAAYSVDRGATWTLATFTVPQSTHSLYSFAAVATTDAPPGIPARVVAGGDGGLYVSDDGGASWRPGPVPVFNYPTLRGEFVLALARPAGGTRLLVAFDVAQSPSIATATSDDGGQTWAMGPGLDEPAGSGLGWPNIDGLVQIGPRSALAVLGRGRVHRTDDGGLTWVEVAQVPRDTDGVTMNAAALGSDGRLYVATNQIGTAEAWVYRTSEIVVAAEPRPQYGGARPQLDAYPNPATGRVVVTYEHPRTSVVRVVIHDPLGREVEILHDGPLSEGIHRMDWHATTVAPGSYAIRIEGPAVGLARMVFVSR